MGEQTCTSYIKISNDKLGEKLWGNPDPNSIRNIRTNNFRFESDQISETSDRITDQMHIFYLFTLFFFYFFHIILLFNEKIEYFEYSKYPKV